MLRAISTIMLAFLYLGVLTGCGTKETPAADANLARPDPPAEYSGLTNPEAGSRKAIDAGSGIYNIHCVMCHGESGKGDGPAAGSLNPKPKSLAANQAGLSDAYLFWRISEGGLQKPFSSAMPAWKTILSENERWEIIAYIRTLINN